ncbi:MAG TPA: hypothetical protein VE821_04650 [Pyrinomonadaceae bacterium]|nr:hypothetical protein [Pyrinomonadaceae bacterium]
MDISFFYGAKGAGARSMTMMLSSEQRPLCVEQIFKIRIQSDGYTIVMRLEKFLRNT